jgi:hypothetical protein
MNTNAVETVGSFARKMIVLNPAMSNKELLALVKTRFPTNATTIACIAWYKSDMKKNEKNRPIIEPIKRTLEIIGNDIVECKMRLNQLEIERDTYRNEEEEFEKQELARLMAKYNV